MSRKNINLFLNIVNKHNITIGKGETPEKTGYIILWVCLSIIFENNLWALFTFTFSNQGNFVVCKFVCGFGFAREGRVIIISGNWVQAQSKEVSEF